MPPVDDVPAAHPSTRAHAGILADVLRARVIRLGALPVLPEKAIQVLALARRPDVDPTTLAAALEANLDLQSPFVQLCAALHSSSSAIERGAAAELRRLPQGRSYELLLAAALYGLTRQPPPHRQHRARLLWRHALLTAILAERLRRAPLSPTRPEDDHS
jgi:HD-like signal output (HDOD) protein